MTLIEQIEAAARQLEAAGVSFGHGTTNAFDEAAWLVLWACGLPLDTDVSAGSVEANRPLAGEESTRVATLLIARIETRKPAAYLTQEAWLQGIPSEHTRKVLDLCTGNGSLAVLAAMAYPDVTVDAADISGDALEVAKINIGKHALQARISVLQSDGLQNCPGPYDLILCNPPYVNSQSMAALPAEYQAEPALALDGGADGMDFIRPLLAAAPEHLSDRGVLVLELGHERAHFEHAFPQLEAVWLETSAGGDQVLLLTRDSLHLL
jgi:ribosomal protein L3 glutamine methyltransferase